MIYSRRTNPIVSQVNGTLTCGVFPRERGRYEVVCSLVKPTGEVTVSSHGTFPEREAALERARDVAKWMKKNPYPRYLGTKYYLVSADERRVLPFSFNTVTQSFDFARAHKLVQRGYTGIVGKRVLSMIQRGLITEGIKYENPIRYVDGWQYGRTGKVYPRREQALTQMRAIHWERGRRNPGITEKRGSIFGGMGILAIPLIVGLILWIRGRKSE